MNNSIEIMLVCSAGMSTSMLVRAMKNVISDRNLKVNVFAKPSTDAMEYLDEYPVDVVLLGPHVRFFEDNYKEELAQKKIPVTVIPPRDYGTMNGEKVLELAMNLLKK